MTALAALGVTLNEIVVRVLIGIATILAIVAIRRRVRERHIQESHKSAERVGAVARWLLPSAGSFCVFIVLCLLMINASRFLQDSDTGWHIRSGDLIWQTHAAPITDTFSFTMQGREWFAWEWLTDAMMSAMHRARGLAGIVGIAILLLCASYAALYRSILRRGADPLVACGFTLFGAVFSMVHWLARPHLLSIGLMIAWCALIESYRRRRSKWIYAAPLLTALWANLHGAFVVTFVMLGIYAVGEIVEFWRRREWHNPALRKALATYGLTGALSALAGLVNPYGFKLYSHLWQYLGDHNLLNMIDEFRSPDFHTLDGKLVELMLLLGGIATAQAIRRGRFVEVGLILFWSHMTLQSQRHVTLAAVVLMPIIAEQITFLFGEIVSATASTSGTAGRWWRAAVAEYRSVLDINRQLKGGAGYLAVAVFLLVLVASSRADNMLSPHFDDKRFPVAAADFIATASLSGNPYTYDQWGGYLIYRLSPPVKVFVDGRSDFYRQSSVLDDYGRISEIKPEWQSLLEKYGIGWMLLRREEPLAIAAPLTGRWVSVYSDSTALVLARKSDAAERWNRLSLASLCRRCKPTTDTDLRLK